MREGRARVGRAELLREVLVVDARLEELRDASAPTNGAAQSLPAFLPFRLPFLLSGAAGGGNGPARGAPAWPGLPRARVRTSRTQPQNQ